MKPFSNNLNFIRRARPCLGTLVDITLMGASAGDLQEIVDEVFQQIEQVHRLMSFHDEQSDVSRLNRYAFQSPVTVHPWTYQVLQHACRLSEETQGVFDVTIAPHLQKRGLLPVSGSAQDYGSHVPHRYRTLAFYPHDRIRFLHPRTQIDLGGIAKGYALDRAIDFLADQYPHVSGIVNAGGDLRSIGDMAFPVEIRCPFSEEGLGYSEECQTPDTVFIKNEAFCNSTWRNPSIDVDAATVVDPFHPRDDSVSSIACGVMGPSSKDLLFPAMYCDALTKIVLIKGLESQPDLQKWQLRGYLILSDGSFHVIN